MKSDLYEPIIQDAINNYPGINNELRQELEKEVCSFSNKLILYKQESDNRKIAFWNIEYFLELGLSDTKISESDKKFWKDWAIKDFHNSSNSEKLFLFIDLKNCIPSKSGMYVMDAVY